jgi:protein SCO1
MERKILWAGLFLLGFFLIISVVISVNNRNEFIGAEISPAPHAPDFSTLSDQKGQHVNLEDLRGKLVLIYFGYTNCPDFCPTTMIRLNQVVSDLDERAEDVVVIMVTTDPLRDTPEKLGSYLVNFNPSFLGLTGTLPDLETVWKNYGVSVLDNGTTHSTRIYVIDQMGKLRLTFPYEMSPTDMVSDLKILLRSK